MPHRRDRRLGARASGHGVGRGGGRGSVGVEVVAGGLAVLGLGVATDVVRVRLDQPVGMGMDGVAWGGVGR
jgi:hypothetical protein